MRKFPGNHQPWPKLSQEEIENLNTTIMSKEIDLVIKKKKKSTKKNSGPGGLTDKIYHMFEE